MTNFAKAWLAVPQEVRDLFKPDDRQEWACPDCGKISGKNIVFTAKWCQNCGKENRYPIPRLDQLLGIVCCIKWKLIKTLDMTGEWFHLLIKYKGQWEGEKTESRTKEEAVLKGICWEHRLTWNDEDV